MCHLNSLHKEFTNKEKVNAILLFDMARLNERSERRHDYKAQNLPLRPTAFFGDSTAPVSTAAGHSFNPLQFQPILSFTSRPLLGDPTDERTDRACSLWNVSQETL